jgi:hypothetical protein
MHIPDPSNILPYIGLNTIVPLQPDQLVDLSISTCHFPGLSILRDGQWIPARLQTSPTTPNVARIFDALALPAMGATRNPGIIPLHASQPEYSQTRYWRLPKTTLGGILSAVMLRAINRTHEGCEELGLAKALYSLLSLQETGVGTSASGSGGPGGGGTGGPDGNASGGRSAGPSKGRPSTRKRGAEGESSNTPSKKPTRGSKNKKDSSLPRSKSCSIDSRGRIDGAIHSPY